MSRFRPLFLILICLTLVTSNTVGQSTAPKAGFIKQQYHNITSRYNGYFNGNEILTEILLNLALTYQDNYAEILPVFPLGTEEAAQSVSADAERVTKKASFVIQRHEIGRWVDDCYVMIGKSYFYKRDYFTAIESFQFVIGKYQGTSAELDALIWLARSYLQLNKLSQAELTLSIAATKFSQRTRALWRDYHLTYADYLIRSKNYRKGIEELLNALSYPMPRELKARYYYIVAQLYELTGRGQRSIIFFKRVIRKTPTYEMVFNARISIARLYENPEDPTKKKRSIYTSLRRMLRDEKNVDYKDQIYFTLAQISLKKGDKPAAVDYLKLSAQHSTTNKQQKAISYLTLANLCFDSLAAFEQAGLYYDSTLIYLSKTYPDYERITYKRDNLGKLVENLATIREQDSLQKVVYMGEAERKKLLDRMVKQQIQQIQQAKIKKNTPIVNPSIDLNAEDNNSTTKTIGAGKGWYFYNSSALGIGTNEFFKKWGRRPLEDDWRRSNKESINALNDPSSVDSISSDSSQNQVTPEAIKAQLLSNLPQTPEKLAISNDKIIEAYWNLGNIYKEQLRDPKSAIKIFDTLTARYPVNKYTLESYYQLYRIYETMDNKNMSIVYEQKILQQFPTSIYAEIIRNPDFAKKANVRANKLNELYENAYSSYVNGSYSSIETYQNQAMELYPDNETKARFAYLSAQVIGKTRTKEEYLDALQKIADTYKETIAGKAAIENITIINQPPNEQ